MISQNFRFPSLVYPPSPLHPHPHQLIIPRNSQLEQADDMIQTLLAEKKQLSEKNQSLVHNLDKFEESKRKVVMLAEDLKVAEEERDEEAAKKAKWEATATGLKKELKQLKEEFEDLRSECTSMEDEIAEMEAARKQMNKGEVQI